MGLLSRLFGPKAIVIDDPSLGVLDLMSGESDDLINSDEKSFFQHFRTVEKSKSRPPRCDVLIVYAKFSSSGKLIGTPKTLREIIRDSGAVIAIFAIDNDPDGYIAAGKDVGFGYANLVMTIERNEQSFGVFFDKLFYAMRQGKTMPVVWNKLAPQIPGIEHTNVPGAIFACERGQLTFGRG